jgi:WLM domain
MNKEDVFGFIVISLILSLCAYIYLSNGEAQLTCIVSSVDGNKYCVRERSRMKEAANLLASTTKKCTELVKYVFNKFPNQENVKRLNRKFNPKKMMEILPTSNYTAYSENKGEKIAFCLTVKKGNDRNLIDEHTLMFVAIHELSHVMSLSVGHKTEFWENFKFLLENAKEAKIHEPIDYSKTPTEYCSLKINDSPYFEL